ncbi:hypothetical protein GQ53DRAFT_327314 [Thozetella sp. PMI_491]|nr:hypothetical protein GQ53DRAFT_327314 [Thozetella sp. PMI_491]
MPIQCRQSLCEQRLVGPVFLSGRMTGVLVRQSGSKSRGVRAELDIKAFGSIGVIEINIFTLGKRMLFQDKLPWSGRRRFTTLMHLVFGCCQPGDTGRERFLACPSVIVFPQRSTLGPTVGLCSTRAIGCRRYYSTVLLLCRMRTPRDANDSRT